MLSHAQHSSSGMAGFRGWASRVPHPAAIPWAELGPCWVLAPGAVLHFQLAVAQQSCSAFPSALAMMGSGYTQCLVEQC